MPKLVVIGGSAGSIQPLKTVLAGLPPDFAAAVLIAFHTGARESFLPFLLEEHCALPVRHAAQGEPITAGQVLVAPADLHLLVAEDGGQRYAKLIHGPKENHSRPAIDPLFRSAATVYGPDALAVLLSGYLDDGTVGIQAIKAYRGTAVVQDPQEADAPEMPASAVAHASIDFVLRADDIPAKLVELVGAQAHPPEAAAAGTGTLDRIAVEGRMLDKEDTSMEELSRIGTLVPLTCPECQGALWEVRDAAPLRYRCHTGHAFTAKVFSALQSGAVEDALWAAVRALHEQEQLYQRFHDKARDLGQAERASEYRARADQTREQAQVLRDLITARADGRSVGDVEPIRSNPLEAGCTARRCRRQPTMASGASVTHADARTALSDTESPHGQ